MLNITEYITESYNNKWLNNYCSAVRDFLAQYNKHLDNIKKSDERVAELKNKKETGKARGPMIYNRVQAAIYNNNVLKTRGSNAFKGYPIAIATDKLGYEVKERQKKNHNAETEIDWGDYSQWLYQQITDGKTSINELATLWMKYDEEIAKKNWCDPMWLLKQVDKDKFWNPFYPDDDSCWQAVVKNPIEIIRYIKSKNADYWMLSKDERNELEEYYADPTRKDILSKKIKGLEKQVMALRPTEDSAVQKHIESLFEIYHINKHIKLEGHAKNVDLDTIASDYQGSSKASQHASAIARLIRQAIKDYWGDDKKKLIKELEWCDFVVVDHGPSKENHTEHSAVVSSSFWTYYNDDFTISILRDGNELFNKDYNNIEVYADYFSGGWN